MLALYVHTHWSYNHPYAARTWTLDNWTGYLECLKKLGYDTVLIWPQLETMPVNPTPSDTAFLDKVAGVIDVAHKRFGMKIIIVIGANGFPNEKAAQSTFEARYFWDTIGYIDPSRPDQVKKLIDAKRAQFTKLAAADGYAMIDSDPGEWKGSPPEEFALLFRAHGELVQQINPKAMMYYWMWQGWPNTQEKKVFVDILTEMKRTIRFPWELLSCNDTHAEVTDEMGLADRRTYFYYNLVEIEPSFPLINCTPTKFRREVARYDPKVYPGGLIVNAQTHCLQIPYIYLSAHYGRGGTFATERLGTLGEKIVEGAGGFWANTAWLYMDDEPYRRLRYGSRRIKMEIGKGHKPGPLAGLVMMSPDQFMLDIADNLDIQADMIELTLAVDAGCDAKKELLQAVSHLRSYQARVGYNHISWDGPFTRGFIGPIARMENEFLNTALHFQGSPVTTKGYMVNLIDTVEAYAKS